MERKMKYGEREINLLHLMCYMLEKYKSLVVMLVMGAVLGLGVGMIKKQETVESQKAENVTAEVTDYVPIKEVMQKMEIAEKYRKLYEQQREYIDNSIIMQLDANNVCEGRAAYYLNCVGDEGEITAAYAAIIENKDVLKGLAEIAGVETTFVREIVSSSYARSSFNAEINNAAGVITFYITHFDKKVCEEMLGYLMEQVEIFNQQYSEKYGKYEFRKVTEVLVERSNTAYIDKQNTNIDKLNKLNNTVVDQEGKFTGNDLIYYQINFLNKDIDAAYVTNDMAEEKAITEQKKESNEVKNLVIAIGVAFVFWAIFWGVKYLTDNRIFTKEDAEEYYNFPVIGHVNNQVKKSLYSKWKKYNFDTEEYLKYILKSLENDGVVVSGYDGKEVSSDIVCCFEEYLFKNRIAMEKAKEVGNIVIGVHLEKSTYEEVEREVELCMVQGVKIVGMLVWE